MTEYKPTAVLVTVDSDIWQSILNRKGSVKTAQAFEYVCLKFLLDAYPKEQESKMKSIIDMESHKQLKTKFDEILKEVRGNK